MTVVVTAQEAGVARVLVTMAVAGLLIKDGFNPSGQRVNILSLYIGELRWVECFGQRFRGPVGMVRGDRTFLFVHAGGLAGRSGSVLRVHEANTKPG